MLTWPLVLAALAAGLMGGVHCVGMCGGLSQWLLPPAWQRRVIPIAPVASARSAVHSANLGLARSGQTLDQSQQARVHSRQFLTYSLAPSLAQANLLPLLALHAGRLSTYALIGALAGSSGALALGWGQIPHWPLFLLGNLTLLYLAARLAGWHAAWSLPQGWRARLAGWLRYLPRPANHPPFVNGLAWGCMPCGLLYSVLPFALLSGAAWSGALLMLLFGLSSLPHLLMLPLAGRAGRHWPRLRPLLALLLSAWAGLGLLQMAGLIPALTTDWCIAG